MNETFIQSVYDTVSGFLVEEAQIPGVENLFQPGKTGHALVEKAYKAYDRIRDRYNVESVAEIEDILDAYEAVCKLVGYKMYEYGAKFGTDGNHPAE